MIRFCYVATFFLLLIQNASAFSFKQAMVQIESHKSVEAMLQNAHYLREEAAVKGSWGDPMFMLAARNFPRESLKNDQTPMTAVEFAVSQKISLTPKFGKMRDSIMSMAEAKDMSAKQQERILVKGLWVLAIEKRRLLQDISILKDNISWIENMLGVSKRLYASGKTSQQGLLDIEIRKSELEAELESKNFELKQLDYKLAYIFGNSDSSLEIDSVPWGMLKDSQALAHDFDFQEKALSSVLESRSLNLSAQKLGFVPDITLSVNYMKRANIDNKGDFVGASISFPLPFSADKYSRHSQATHERYKAEKDLLDYRNKKKADLEISKLEIKKFDNDLKILQDKTLKYSRNARNITAKSYSYGKASYFELLQAELKLQQLLMKETMLKAGLDVKKIELRFIAGEKIDG